MENSNGGSKVHLRLTVSVMIFFSKDGVYFDGEKTTIRCK